MDALGIVVARWAGPWATPNLAGAALVQVLALLPTIALITGHSRSWAGLRLAMTLAGTVAIAYLLVATGSRGSWLAEILIIAWWAWWAYSQPSARKALTWCGSALILGTFLGVIVYAESAQRAEGLLQPLQDYSGSSRLALWHAAVVMAYDHPLTGIGDFGSVFNNWYVPPWMANNYWPMVISDPLQIAANWGVVTLGVATSILAALIVVGIRPCDNHRSMWYGTSGVLIAAFVASVFSNLAWRPWCLAPAIAAAAVLSIRWAISRSIWPIVVGVVCGGALAIGIYAVGWWRSSQESAIVWSSPLTDVAVPRGMTFGRIAIVGGPDDTMASLIQGPGRSLVSSGWAVEIATHANRHAISGTLSGMLVYGGGQGGDIPRQDLAALVVFDPHLAPVQTTGRPTLLIGRADRLPSAANGMSLLVYPKARCWPKDFTNVSTEVCDFIMRVQPR